MYIIGGAQISVHKRGCTNQCTQWGVGGVHKSVYPVGVSEVGHTTKVHDSASTCQLRYTGDMARVGVAVNGYTSELW